MARKLRLEVEGGLYHVLNRGNYRSAIFRAEKTKQAFLRCLDEACRKTGWVIHAWCLMSHHYHLAIETPQPNLVEGMRWLQGTFGVRFNRLRKEHGRLFQGRYKSVIVDPGEGRGPLCHYIHLNPVRARLCAAEELPEWRWSSMHWLANPRQRPKWYDPTVALEHAGGLADTAAGRRKYVAYLGWLAEEAGAQKAQRFEQMSQGWVVGTTEFKRVLAQEHRAVAVARANGDLALSEAQEAVRQQRLDQLLQQLGRTRADLAQAGKSESWKVALGAALKTRTTATNRWLSENLKLGNLHEVSRKVNAWQRAPDARLARILGFSPNPKV